MPKKRLQDVMEAHFIKPLKRPPKYSRPIILDGIEDPKLPKQIAEELTKRNDFKGEFRIKLKSSDEYSIFIIYNAV